jgi:HK97 family phage major capsid protein
LTSKKLSAVTYLSGELDEDSITAIRPYVETKLAKAYAEVLDKSIIN